MSDIEKMDRSLQQNVLTVLLFDDKFSHIVKNTIPIESWVGTREILNYVRKVYSFIEEYKEPPKAHAYDLISDAVDEPDAQRALIMLVDACTEHFEEITHDYISNKLERFHREATIKSAIQSSVELLQQGKLDEIETLLHASLKNRLQTFEPGVSLQTVLQEICGIDDSKIRNDQVMLDIPALDDRGIVPTRKEMYLFVAPAKRGKTHFLVHVGKQALIEGKKVCHVSLEMGEMKIGERYLQSIYALTKRNASNKFQVVLNNTGDDFETINMPNRPVLRDDATLDFLFKKLKSDRFFTNNLIIKQFPTSKLTVQGLAAYLDSLEMQKAFRPDVLIVDYPDLFHVKNLANPWFELGMVYKELRGLAVERDLILVVVSQIGKEGGKDAKGGQSDRYEGNDIAGAYSKIQDADAVVTYAQKDSERALGLARLFISNGRNEEDRIEILINQNYATGQFCLFSVEHTKDWKNKVTKLSEFMGV